MDLDEIKMLKDALDNIARIADALESLVKSNVELLEIQKEVMRDR